MPGQPGSARASEAAGALYEHHSERLLAYCLFRLGSREEAEDALQTTFVHALRALNRGVVPRMEEAWLFTIAQNVCLSRRRSAGCRGRRELASDPQSLGDVAAAPERGADELFGLSEALASVPERQRRALLLREWQGLSYREIGISLGLEQAAVETLIFRGRRSLARALDSGTVLRRRLRSALDLGILAGWLKPLVTGGPAANVAAGVASVTATAVLAGDAYRAPTGPRPPPLRAGVITAEPAPGWSVRPSLKAGRRDVVGVDPSRAGRRPSPSALATSGVAGESRPATAEPVHEEASVAPPSPGAGEPATRSRTPAAGGVDRPRPGVAPVGRRGVATLPDLAQVLADPVSTLPEPELAVPLPDTGSLLPDPGSVLPDAGSVVQEMDALLLGSQPDLPLLP